MADHLFDPDEGARRRDEALARVEEHAPEDWNAVATRAVLSCADRLYKFTTDDVWWQLEELGTSPPPEPRALGAVVRRLALAGRIVNTGEWRKSDRAAAHRRPISVWRAA